MTKNATLLTSKFETLNLHFSSACNRVLEQILPLFFRRPDIAVRSAMSRLDPTPERVISNFLQGIYLGQNERTLGLEWRSTNERAIITPESARIPGRLKNYMNRELFEIRHDTAFREVVHGCQRIEEWDPESDPFYQIHQELFNMGYSTSMEAWSGGKLAGGILGLQIGRSWSVISMFHKKNHAGSILFCHLVGKLLSGELEMIDCGLMKEHFRRFGAGTVGVDEFVDRAVNGLVVSKKAG